MQTYTGQPFEKWVRRGAFSPCSLALKLKHVTGDTSVTNREYTAATLSHMNVKSSGAKLLIQVEEGSSPTCLFVKFNQDLVTA